MCKMKPNIHCVQEHHATIVSTRHYRAPEVVLGDKVCTFSEEKKNDMCH